MLAAKHNNPAIQTTLVKLLIDYGADYNTEGLFQLAQTNQELSFYLRQLYVKDQVTAIALYFFAGLASFFLVRTMLRR